MSKPAVGRALTSVQWYEFWRMGDVNLDGRIDSADLDLIEQHLGSFFPAADINEDSIVDQTDLVIAANHYGMDIWSYFGVSRPLEWWHWIIIGGGALFFIWAAAKVARRKDKT